jgi:hypothetical protein
MTATMPNTTPGVSSTESLSHALENIFFSSNPDRRNEHRYQVAEEVKFKVEDDPHRERVGTVQNISRSGMALISPERIEPGLVMVVHLRTCNIVAESRNCQELTDGGFSVGLLIHSLITS